MRIICLFLTNNKSQDALDFMTRLAKKTGKLIKGGEPDLNNVAVSVINDFQRVRTRDA